MPLNTLKDLLIEQLSELRQAEKHGQETLPRLAAAASSAELATAFRAHADLAREHVDRLDAIFMRLQATPHHRETRGMKGLLKDCMKLAGTTEAEPHVRDAALIGVAQHVMHDEIAGYGCARTWAEVLGLSEAASTLKLTLADERQADAELTRLAHALNRTALEAATA